MGIGCSSVASLGVGVWLHPVGLRYRRETCKGVLDEHRRIGRDFSTEARVALGGVALGRFEERGEIAVTIVKVSGLLVCGLRLRRSRSRCAPDKRPAIMERRG